MVSSESSEAILCLPGSPKLAEKDPFLQRRFRSSLLLLLCCCLSLLSTARRGIHNSCLSLPSQGSLTWLQNAPASLSTGEWMVGSTSPALEQAKLMAGEQQQCSHLPRAAPRTTEGLPVEQRSQTLGGVTLDREKIQCKTSPKHNQPLGLLEKEKHSS